MVTAERGAETVRRRCTAARRSTSSSPSSTTTSPAASSTSRGAGRAARRAGRPGHHRPASAPAPRPPRGHRRAQGPQRRDRPAGAGRAAGGRGVSAAEAGERLGSRGSARGATWSTSWPPAMRWCGCSTAAPGVRSGATARPAGLAEGAAPPPRSPRPAAGGRSCRPAGRPAARPPRRARAARRRGSRGCRSDRPRVEADEQAALLGQQPGQHPEHLHLGVVGEEDHHVADHHDHVVRRGPVVRREQLRRERQQVGLDHADVGEPLARDRHQRGVLLDRRDVVAAAAQGLGHPAHAGAGVEHPGAARGQDVGQPGLAVVARAGLVLLEEGADVARLAGVAGQPQRVGGGPSVAPLTACAA